MDRDEARRNAGQQWQETNRPLLDDIHGVIGRTEDTPEGRVYSDGFEDINVDHLPKGSRRGFQNLSRDTRRRFDLTLEREPEDAPEPVANMFRGFLQRHAPIIRQNVSRTNGQQSSSVNVYQADEQRMLDDIEDEEEPEQPEQPAVGARAVNPFLDPPRSLVVDTRITEAQGDDSPGTQTVPGRPAPSDVPRGGRAKHSKQQRLAMREQRRRARFPEPIPTAGLMKEKDAEKAEAERLAQDKELDRRQKEKEINTYIRALRMYGPMVKHLHQYTFDIMCERSVHAVWANYVCELSMRREDRPIRSFRTRMMAIIEQPLYVDAIDSTKRELAQAKVVARFQDYTPRERNRNLRVFHGKTFMEIIDTNRFNTYIQDFLFVAFVFEFMQKVKGPDGTDVWQPDLRVTDTTELDPYVPKVESLGQAFEPGLLGDLQCRLADVTFLWHELGE